jgi:dGTPase
MAANTDAARAERRHTPEHDERQRTPFQRDRDSILYTTAFRRLAGVTQVVSPGEGHVYHNRLTHTLEVAQIGQRLAEYLVANQSELAAQHGGIDPSVVEAAALAHDLGHPPFGHVAEKELNRLLLEHKEIGGYEGNAQSFRIITKLAVRRATPGLNLTRATLNATLKYPWPQEADENGKQRRRKWGVYAGESDDFQFARSYAPGESPCLEAQLMDWADDIAYSIHDTEDFYRAGLIPLGYLSQDPQAVDRFLERAFTRWDQDEFEPSYPREDLANTFHKLCATLPFAGPHQPTRAQRAQLRGLTSDFIGRYITNTRLLEKPAEDGSLLKVEDEFKMQVTMLKELTWQFVIKQPSLASVQHGQRQALRTLFNVFADCVLKDKHGPWAILPARSRDDMECLYQRFGPQIPDAERVRVAADAVAMMTDQQAILMYHRLIGASPGSVLDAIVF